MISLAFKVLVRSAVRKCLLPLLRLVLTDEQWAEAAEIGGKPVDEPITCTQCDSANVQRAVRVRLNTGEVLESVYEDDSTDGATWCEDCCHHVILSDN